MKSEIFDKWDLIKQTLREQFDIIDLSYNMWISPLILFDVRGDEIIIGVDDNRMGPAAVSLMTKKYGTQLSTVIESMTGKPYSLKFVSTKDWKQKNGMTAVSPDNTVLRKEPEVNPYPFLNPRYTFDTFVVGNNNNLAHAAALAVAESPGNYYNPLFIYGGVGLGKTHLMHSIARYILEHNPDYKVLYTTSEKFTNDLIDSIRNEKSAAMEFRKKYRNIDVLLIDDIQFIIGKERTQEEFFHTFNSLYDLKKQIVISSDKPPKEIETLEERLRSRFECGLIVDIQQPDYETRVAILKKKEELDHLQIDSEIIEYIAKNIHSNIRELEGALTKIVALSRLKNQKITPELAEEALRDLISPDEAKKITPERITRIVAEHYGITVPELTSTNKSKKISYPRQICMYLSRNYTEATLDEIGDSVGGKDHATVLHGINKIETDMKNNSDFAATIASIVKKINPQ